MVKTRERQSPTTSDEREFFRIAHDELQPIAAPQPIRRTSLPHRPSFATIRVSRPVFVRALQNALRREAGLGTPFLFLPVGLILGTLSYFSVPVEPAPWNVLLGLGLLALGLFALRNRPGTGRYLLILAAAAVSGMALAQAHTHWKATSVLGSDVTTRLTGRILEIEERAGGRTRYTIEVVNTERPKLRYAPDIVRATAAGTAESYSVGGGIHGVVRLTSPSGPAHPGGYDFAFHSYFDGIGAYGFFLGKPEPTDIDVETGVLRASGLRLERLRQSIGSEIGRIVPGRSGAVATALITGNKAGIPEEVNEALRISGLAHILSISGLHMALAAATVMATLRLGFAFFPHWSSRHPVKKYAAAGALAATAFYLFLAGAGVATQRSFIMLAIMLLALTFDRNAVTLRNLALAAIAVVAIAPHEVAGPGFQMSFAATAALIAVYTGWQEHARRRDRRPGNQSEPGPIAASFRTILRYALGIAVTSAVAGLATGIFAAYHFGRVAPYGLLGNLLAMPVVTMLVMPFAVAAVIAMPFGLHVYPFRIMAWAVELVIGVADWVAGLSPAFPVCQMPGASLLGFSAALALLCLPTTWLRWLALPLVAASALLWRADTLPLAVISEDAKQFALVEPVEGGTRLHVNRTRPNAFTLEQWIDAYRGAELVKPTASDRVACEGKLCTAFFHLPSGIARIAYVGVAGKDLSPNGQFSVRHLCAGNDMVIFAKAPSLQSCTNGTPVLSAQMLARYGAAEIRLNRQRDGFYIRHALPDPVRPWVDHRKYSRAARNLGDWKPRKDD